MIWFGIVLFIFIVILLLLATRINVAFSYLFVLEGSHELEVRFSIFRIRISQRRINFRKKEGVVDDFISILMEKSKHRQLESVIKKIRITSLSWETSIATGDVISTGMSAGLLWTIKELGLFIVDTYANLRCKPLVNVKPIYEGVTFRTRLACNIAVSIHTALTIYKLLKNNNK